MSRFFQKNSIQKLTDPSQLQVAGILQCPHYASTNVWIPSTHDVRIKYYKEIYKYAGNIGFSEVLLTIEGSCPTDKF